MLTTVDQELRTILQRLSSKPMTAIKESATLYHFYTKEGTVMSYSKNAVVKILGRNK